MAVFVHVERATAEFGRTTKDVDLMIRRSDLPGVIDVASRHGFNRQAAGLDMLQYGDSGKAMRVIRSWRPRKSISEVVAFG